MKSKTLALATLLLVTAFLFGPALAPRGALADTRRTETGGGMSSYGIVSLAGPNPVPVTVSLSPGSMFAGGPAFTLTVNGASFVAGSVVMWNWSARPTTYISATQLTAAISASDIATAGIVEVTVFNPQPGGGISNPALYFTVLNPVPTATSVSPNTKVAGQPAFTLTVNGTNFVGGSKVRWNGADRATTYLSTTKLTAAITKADIASTGTAYVQVFNPTPGGGTSAAKTFTIRDAPIPTATSVSPNTKVAGQPAFTLTVNGTNFVEGLSKVRWNGADRATTYVSTTKLTAAITKADIASTGTAYVQVFNPAPGGVTSNAKTFTITAAPLPAATTLSPASKTAGDPAFTLTVNGTGFVEGLSKVRWNGEDRITAYASTTKLAAAIPAADLVSADTASVTVFNPTPGGGTSNAKTFTINNRVPTITSLSPTIKTAGDPAFTLTVNGTNFVAGSRVRWKGSDRATTYVSATRLDAAIPAADLVSAGTASVTVFNPAPGGGTSNAKTFTIRAATVFTTTLSPKTKVAG